MKIRQLAILLLCICFLLISVGFTVTMGGVYDEEPPKVLSLAFPKYPELLIPAAYAETVEVELKIDETGQVIEKRIDAKFDIVRQRISKALERWKFEKSDKSVRKATYYFKFDLLPYDADRQISAELIFPNKIVIYENSAKNSNEHY